MLCGFINPILQGGERGENLPSPRKKTYYEKNEFFNFSENFIPSSSFALE